MADLKAVIMRGLPGCGKSTLAEGLIEAEPGETTVLDHYTREYLGRIFSNDDFFMVDGEYRFEPAKIAEANDWNLRRWIEAAQRGLDVIVCANTNITATEIAPYWASAAAYGYECIIMQLECPIEVSLARNVHGVPEEVIREMAELMPVQEKDCFPPWWRIERV